MSKLIKKFTYQTIVDLLYEAKREVFWVSPSLTQEIAHILNELAKSGINVTVLTDIDPDRFRQYEGELEAIEILMVNSKISLRKAEDLGLGFIAIDHKGYAFFNPLRAYEQDGNRYNAFELETKTINNLIHQFFGERVGKNDLFESSQAEQLREKLQIKTLEASDIKKTKEELSKDPPLKLGLKRLINVYRTQFQIVEIKFSGSNLHIKKIKLPKKALPFSDSRLKNSIESQLRLFQDIPKKDFFEPFFELKEQYDMLRAKYVTYLKTREKNIIRKDDKPAFEKEFNELVNKISKVSDDLIARLQEEIIKTKSAIRDNLKQFFIANPTETLSVLKGSALEQGAEQQANDIVGRIRFPSAKDLLDNLHLEKYYYDLTWEDLNDKDVIKEFKQKKLITEDEMSELKNMSKAYEIEIEG